MDHDFWLARWREGRIGFHEGEGSPRLHEGLPWLTGDRAGAVLVPLCGKSVDMRTLAGAGQRVIGVELAESAAQAFFDELTPLPPSPCLRQGEEERSPSSVSRERDRVNATNRRSLLLLPFA